MVITTALILAGSTYFLKYSFEKTEQKNEALIKNLNQANHVIHQQQNLLALENIQLSRDLLEKNYQLTETNEELVRHNNELLQFSYTVSHNLRGPVASLGGLINLFNQQTLTIDWLQALSGYVKPCRKIAEVHCYAAPALRWFRSVDNFFPADRDSTEYFPVQANFVADE